MITARHAPEPWPALLSSLPGDLGKHHDIESGKPSPDHPAIIMAGSGRCIAYGELQARVRAIAALMRAKGIGAGERVVILALNHPAFIDVCLAAREAGIDYTPASKFLTREEVRYIVNNSGAVAIFVSAALAPVVADLDCPDLVHRFVIDGAVPGFVSLDDALGSVDTAAVVPVASRPGREMLYSSGTTGRPKGIRLLDPGREGLRSVTALTAGANLDLTSVNLTPAPLYHAAPLRFATAVALAGATNVIMERFDAEAMLESIQRYRVTHLQVVPTMLIRLLKLPETVRKRYDISSLRFLAHSAGPCPHDVKLRIIEWFGPIVVEHYGGSEGNGLCTITSEEWLAHPGSVGRAVVGRLRIVGDDGAELPAGEVGTIYFEGGPRFEYYGDPEKTIKAYNDRGWSTLGDLGHVDEEGFLYLAERRADLIISGGVNIYPQEIENVLLSHPDIQDAGVVGAPDEEYGQMAVAFVQRRYADGDDASFVRQIEDYCRAQMSGLKVPRRIILTTEFPRDETGKLFKDRLRQRL